MPKDDYTLFGAESAEGSSFQKSMGMPCQLRLVTAIRFKSGQRRSAPSHTAFDLG